MLIWERDILTLYTLALFTSVSVESDVDRDRTMTVRALDAIGLDMRRYDMIKANPKERVHFFITFEYLKDILNISYYVSYELAYFAASEAAAAWHLKAWRNQVDPSGACTRSLPIPFIPAGKNKLPLQLRP